STITDPAGRITRVTIDAAGNLTQVVDPDGAVTRYGYANPADHRMTTETNPRGFTATVEYDRFGRLASETLLGGTSVTQVSAAEEQGLLDPGETGLLTRPAEYRGRVT